MHGRCCIGSLMSHPLPPPPLRPVPWAEGICAEDLCSGDHSNFSFSFLVCRLDKLLSWFSTLTSVVNFRYYLFCLCNVRRQYLLPGIQGIYCFLTGVPSFPAIALPKGCICSLVNQVYTSIPLMSLPLLACTDPMLVKCCAIIYDTLPTLNQHCVRVLSCRCSLQK